MQTSKVMMTRNIFIREYRIILHHLLIYVSLSIAPTTLPSVTTIFLLTVSISFDFQGRSSVDDFGHVVLRPHYSDLFRLYDIVGGENFNIFDVGLKTAYREVSTKQSRGNARATMLVYINNLEK